MWRFGEALKIAALVLLIGLAGCKDDKGPAEVKFGRDTCTMCGMIISDPHYATEVRGGPDNKIVKFDDIGDAMNWLERKGWGLGATTEIWVMNSEDGKTWLDARHAFFRHGMSPMSYGFAALPAAAEGTVTFDEMRTASLKRGVTSMCEPGHEAEEGPESDHHHAGAHADAPTPSGDKAK